MDHIYVVTDRSLYKQPEAIKGDRSRRDIKKNCTFHKDIGHNTGRYVAIRDEIERIIKTGHFKEFMDDPQKAKREEWSHHRSLDKIREVLTIIGGSHIVGEGRSAHNKYTKEAKAPPSIHVHRTKEHPTTHERRELEDIVFTEVDSTWVHHPHDDALVITTRISDNNVQQLMVDGGSTIDIL